MLYVGLYLGFLPDKGNVKKYSHFKQTIYYFTGKVPYLSFFPKYDKWVIANANIDLMWMPHKGVCLKPIIKHIEYDFWVG